MELTNNDFGDLLNYLQKQNEVVVQKTSHKKEVEHKAEEPKIPKVEPVIKKEPEKHKTRSKFTEPYSINKQPQSSSGFDVQKFESLMRAKLVDEHKRMQSYERPYISVTELFQCLRKVYYERMKYQIDISQQFRFSYLYLRQKVGDLFHEQIQSIYDFSEVEKTIVSDKYKVKGRVDALRGEDILYEIKSLDPDKFRNNYVQEHYYQGLVYSFILNTEYNYKIKTITIVYVLLNCKKIVPFDLPYDSNLANGFLNCSVILQKNLSSHTVPEKINSSEEQCKYCSYIDFCKVDSKNEPQILIKSKKSDRQQSVFLL